MKTMFRLVLVEQSDKDNMIIVAYSASLELYVIHRKWVQMSLVIESGRFCFLVLAISTVCMPSKATLKTEPMGALWLRGSNRSGTSIPEGIEPLNRSHCWLKSVVHISIADLSFVDQDQTSVE